MQVKYTKTNMLIETDSPRVFNINDLVFVIKFSQSTGKLDPGMRGPYKVVRALPSGRYELRLLGGSYGKTTQAAAQYMVPWKGEWCPDTCAAFFEQADSTGGITTPDYEKTRRPAGTAAAEAGAGPSRIPVAEVNTPALTLAAMSDAVEDDA